MPKDTDIQTHWADVVSAVKIARSNVVAQKRNPYGGNFLKKLSNIGNIKDYSMIGCVTC